MIALDLYISYTSESKGIVLFFDYSYYLWLKIISLETKCHTTAGMKHRINFGPRLYNSLIKSNPDVTDLRENLEYLYKFCLYPFIYSTYLISDFNL